MEFQEIENNQRDLGDAFLPALIHHKTGEILNIKGLPDEGKKLLKVFEQLIEEALQFITDGAPFFKMYEGDDPLQGSPLKRYYDEQEWRAAPDDQNSLVGMTSAISYARRVVNVKSFINIVKAYQVIWI